MLVLSFVEGLATGSSVSVNFLGYLFPRRRSFSLQDLKSDAGSQWIHMAASSIWMLSIEYGNLAIMRILSLHEDDKAARYAEGFHLSSEYGFALSLQQPLLPH